MKPPKPEEQRPRAFMARALGVAGLLAAAVLALSGCGGGDSERASEIPESCYEEHRQMAASFTGAAPHRRRALARTLQLCPSRTAWARAAVQGGLDPTVVSTERGRSYVATVEEFVLLDFPVPESAAAARRAGERESNRVAQQMIKGICERREARGRPACR